VNIPNSSTIDMTTNDFTIEVWAKSNGFVVGGAILLKQSWFEANGPGYFIAYPTNPQNIYVGVYDTKRHIINTELGPTFDWTHIVMVKQGTIIKAYINSIEKTSGGESTTDVAGSLSNTKNLLIGKNEYNNQIFNGLIDEARIYNRALSAEEIKRHYEMSK